MNHKISTYVLVSFFFLAISTFFITAGISPITPSLNLNGQDQFSITGYNMSGNNINWTDLHEFPVACPTGSYLTQLGDSVTCTSLTGVSQVIADDATDIQTKLDSASEGSVVFIPEGNYTINTAINITGHKQIRCESKLNTILIVNNSYGFYTNNNSVMDIQNCRITGSGGSFTATGKIGIYTSQWADNRNITTTYYIENNVFDHLISAIRYKQSEGKTGDIIIKDNVFEDMDYLGSDGFSPDGTFAIVSIQAEKPTNKRWEATGNSFFRVLRDEAKAISFNGNDSSDDGSSTGTISYPRATGIIVSNNILYNVSSDGIYIHSTDGAIITNNEVYFYGQNNGNHQVAIACNNCKYSKISDNVVREGYGRAVRTEGGSHNYITDNILYGGSQTANIWEGSIFRISSNDSTYARNQITSFKDIAIIFSADGNRNKVVDNKFFGSNTTIIDLGYNNFVGNNEFVDEEESGYYFNNLDDDERLMIALNFNNKSVTDTYVLDSSKNEYDGTLEDSPEYLPTGGIYGSGTYKFNTTNSIKINNNDNLEIPYANSSFTIMLWLNKTGDNAVNGRYITKSSSAGGWAIQSYSSGNGIFLRIINTSNSVIPDIAGLSSTVEARLNWNENIHYTWTSDGTTYKFYRNGILANSLAVTRSDPTGGTANLRLGADSFGTTGMNGSLDDFRFYNEALSQTEIRQIVNNKKSPTPTYLSRSGGVIRGALSLMNITPITDSLYSLGSTSLRYLKGWFVDLDVSGTAIIENATITNLNVTSGLNGDCLNVTYSQGVAITCND